MGSKTKTEDLVITLLKEADIRYRKRCSKLGIDYDKVLAHSAKEDVELLEDSKIKFIASYITGALNSGRLKIIEDGK